MSVTIKDVAKLANVSTATVSRVINNDRRIRQETKDKVTDCIQKLGYKVNNVARSLKTSRTYTIGFITPEISNAFFMNIAKGLEDELKKHGYSLIICNSNENIEEEKERIKLLLEKCVDGIIIAPSSSEGKHFSQLKKFEIPVVLVDRLVNNFTTDAVLVDNVNGCYAAVEHMINKGYRRIGFIGGDIKLTSGSERYEGYKRALIDYSITYESEIIKFGDFHASSGYHLMAELLNMNNPPECIVISNYHMHYGATKYLIDHRDRILHKVAIASFDDMELSSILDRCTIRVAQPMMEIGSKAAELVIKRINDVHIPSPQIVRLKTRLVGKGEDCWHTLC